jgi:16S rRNA processing protein RimM
MTQDNWSLTVGEVVASFGRIGEVKVRLETDFPNHLTQLKQVCLRGPNSAFRLYEIENARLHKRQILLKLRGVDSIDEAERLRSSLVQIRPEEAAPLSANEFYIHDLLGCEVVTAEGHVLGPLTSVLRGPANDVYVIGQGKTEILLPVVRDVVREVNLNQRRIVVTPTEGLLPEDHAD